MKRSIIALIISLSCLLSLGYTTTGLKILLRLLPGTVHYSAVNGQLAHHFRINDLRYHYQGLSLDIQSAECLWNPWKLLTKTLDITRFNLNNATITLPEHHSTTRSTSSTSPSSWTITLPLQLTIRRATVHQLHLPQHNITLNEATMALQSHGQQLAINTLSINSTVGELTATGQLNLDAPLDSNIDTQFALNDPKNSELNVTIHNHQFNLLGTGAINGYAKLHLSNQLVGQWELQSAELKTLLPTLSGAISSQGHLSGPAQHPRIKATLNTKQLRIGTINLTQALTLDGTMQQHTLIVDARINNNSLSGRITGHLSDQRWQGTLNTFTISHPGINSYHLSHPTSLQLAPQHIEIGPTCLANRSSQACLQIKDTPEALTLRADIKRMNLMLLNTKLPENTTIKGKLDGTLDLDYQKQQQQWQGKLEATTTKGQLDFTHQGTQQTIPFNPSSLDTTIDHTGTTLSLNARMLHQNNIHLVLASDYQGNGWPTPQNTLHGSLIAKSNDLRLLELMAPTIEQTSGKIDIDTQVTGTLAEPLFSGTATLTNGNITITPLNITLSKINTTLSANHTSTFLLQGTLTSGDGQLTIGGESHLNQAGYPSTLTIQGKKVTLANTHEYQLIATPNLQAHLQHRHLTLTGSIDLPKVIISPTDFSSTVTLPNNVKIIQQGNKATASRQPPITITSDLRINSNHLNINYKGLQALLAGQLRVRQTPGTQTRAQGQLNILEGAYHAYGQHLTINDGGTLSFTNELTNPTLNLSASRRIDIDNSFNSPLPSYQRELIVGIHATGTLDQPTVLLYSDPSGYNQQDILSYLVFGFPQHQLNSSQSAIVWQAAHSLNGGDNSLGNLTNALQETLGLDQLTLSSATEYNPETEAEETGTSLVVGKRINDKLSLTYSMGLVVPVNILYVRYQLSKRFALQSDSSTFGNGADILYSFSSE